MIDFSSHIERGLRAADDVEFQRAEIRGILDQLDQAIRTATLGMGYLHVGEFHHPEDEKVMSIADMRQRLVLRSVDDERQGRIIAGWKTNPEGGYLVTLVYDYMSMTCENGRQLVEELEALMETSRVGRAIRELTG